MITTKHICDLLNNDIHEMNKGGYVFKQKILRSLKCHNKRVRYKVSYLEVMGTTLLLCSDKWFDDYDALHTAIDTALHKQRRNDNRYTSVESHELDALLRNSIDKHARDFTPNIYTQDFIEYVTSHCNNTTLIDLLLLVINEHIPKRQWATKLHISTRLVRRYEKRIREIYQHYSAV